MSNRTIALNSFLIAIMSILISCNISQDIINFAGHAFMFLIAFFVLMFIFVDEKDEK